MKRTGLCVLFLSLAIALHAQKANLSKSDMVNLNFKIFVEKKENIKANKINI